MIVGYSHTQLPCRLTCLESLGDRALRLAANKCTFNRLPALNMTCLSSTCSGPFTTYLWYHDPLSSTLSLPFRLPFELLGMPSVLCAVGTTGMTPAYSPPTSTSTAVPQAPRSSSCNPPGRPLRGHPSREAAQGTKRSLSIIGA